MFSNHLIIEEEKFKHMMKTPQNKQDFLTDDEDLNSGSQNISIVIFLMNLWQKMQDTWTCRGPQKINK